MSNMNVQQRKFIVKAGMTVDDIKNSKEATAMQKKYASAFDTDGQKGFSQKEADLFNSTTFAEKADGTVTFWTRQKDGTKKGTKFNSNDNNIQFKSEDEVKPYIKQVKVKKSVPKQNESVSFFDEKWSGHQIARLTGDNAVTDWLQNKDKVCTDGKDDGKIGLWEGTKSFVKGLVGGIPKAMVNHPITTAVTVAVGAGAIALTGGAIIPVLGAVGVATGVGMAGYGGYKAVTAKTDGEAKQALETLGMGVTTTALSVAAADKALEKAAEAGVKSAQVSEDAGILDKTIQMFKATPEALKQSGTNIKINTGFTTYNQFHETESKALERVQQEYMKDYSEDCNPDILKTLEQQLKVKGIETVGEGYSKNGHMIYHGEGTIEPVGYANPYLTIKYKGTKYSIKPWDENMTPVQLKNRFVMFLEGNASIDEFKIVGIPEVNKTSALYQQYITGKISFQEYYPKMCVEYQNMLKTNPQPSNPFWEVTAGNVESLAQK